MGRPAWQRGSSVTCNLAACSRLHLSGEELTHDALVWCSSTEPRSQRRPCSDLRLIVSCYDLDTAIHVMRSATNGARQTRQGCPDTDMQQRPAWKTVRMRTGY